MKIEDHERLLVNRGEQLCRENGYTDYRMFFSGRDACLVRLMFTFAILADLTEWGYGERWCYASETLARRALAAWDGEGEPEGWHRHPETGRRRPDGDKAREYIAP